MAGRPSSATWLVAIESTLSHRQIGEWHNSGHGLHLHFSVGRFVARCKIVSAWGHGFVHIKLPGDLPVGSGTVAEARKAAGYLSKYVAKGVHRWTAAMGGRGGCTASTWRKALSRNGSG